jgi:hypothetical protein
MNEHEGITVAELQTVREQAAVARRLAGAFEHAALELEVLSERLAALAAVLEPKVERVGQVER